MVACGARAASTPEPSRASGELTAGADFSFGSLEIQSRNGLVRYPGGDKAATRVETANRTGNR